MAYKRVDVGISVSQPHGLAEAFKDLALKRTAARDPKIKRRRVWAQDLYEEAVRDLLLRLTRGEKVVFVASPLKRKENKTVRLDPVLWAQVQEASTRHNVSIAAVVRTALLAFMEVHSIKVE